MTEACRNGNPVFRWIDEWGTQMFSSHAHKLDNFFVISPSIKPRFRKLLYCEWRKRVQDECHRYKIPGKVIPGRKQQADGQHVIRNQFVVVHHDVKRRRNLHGNAVPRINRPHLDGGQPKAAISLGPLVESGHKTSHAARFSPLR